MSNTSVNVALADLLQSMVEHHASDLHLSAGAPPLLRIDGSLVALNMAPLTTPQVRELSYSVLTDVQKEKFEINKELDLSFGIKNMSRFRANYFFEKGQMAAAYRQIPYKIRNFEELGLPKSITEIARKPRGLVLVTGATGSGKSTTLAAIIDHINSERQSHVVTIEDPIEYLHNNKKCLIRQREIGSDTADFKTALKYVLRQDPDIVLIGEMRDLETIEAALSISETGHLVFATLHTNSCVQSINRIIDVFPPHQQSQIRAQLSLTLEGVLCQQLIPKIGGGRALAVEIMLPNSAIRNLMRDDKVHQIYSQMQVGRAKTGMQTLNHHLADLVFSRTISAEQAMEHSSDPEELRTLLTNGGGAILR